MPKKVTTNEFISSSVGVHGAKYDYSKSVYVNCRTKVEVICPKHGSFLITPNDHKKSRGCRACGYDRSNTLEFIQKATGVHNLKYEYPYVVYKNKKEKVKIICRVHGNFNQRPSVHLSGSGCPRCYAERASFYNPKTVEQDKKKLRLESCALYLFKFSDDGFKIGISSNLQRRVRDLKRDSGLFFEEFRSFEINLYDALVTEGRLHDLFKDKRYPLETTFAGYTECFKLSEEDLELLDLIFNELTSITHKREA